MIQLQMLENPIFFCTLTWILRNEIDTTARIAIIKNCSPLSAVLLALFFAFLISFLTLRRNHCRLITLNQMLWSVLFFIPPNALFWDFVFPSCIHSVQHFKKQSSHTISIYNLMLHRWPALALQCTSFATDL